MNSNGTSTMISLPPLVDIMLEQRKPQRASSLFSPRRAFLSPRRRPLDMGKLMSDNGLIRLLKASNSIQVTLDASSSSSTSTTSTCSSCLPGLEPRRSCLKKSTPAFSLLGLYDSTAGMDDCSKASTTRGSSALVSGPKNVTWSTNIEFQLYTTILGDNPSVTCGAPLSLGKPVGAPIQVPWNDYEKENCRSSATLVVSAVDRERILRDSGYCRSELEAMEAKLLHIRLSRRANAKQGLWEGASFAKALKLSKIPVVR